MTAPTPADGDGDGETELDFDVDPDGLALALGLRLLDADGLVLVDPLGDVDPLGEIDAELDGELDADGLLDVDGLPIRNRPKLPGSSALGFRTWFCPASGMTTYQMPLIRMTPPPRECRRTAYRPARRNS